MPVTFANPRLSPVNLIPGYMRLGVGTDMAAFRGAAPSSGAWPSANRAIAIPFSVEHGETAYRLFICLGTTAGNGTTQNLDMGIYARDGTTTAAKVVSMGTTLASTTASAVQYLNITDTFLSPGKYYLVGTMDNATVTILQQAPALANAKASGHSIVTSGAPPLGASLTIALTVATVRIPVMGISFRASP